MHKIISPLTEKLGFTKISDSRIFLLQKVDKTALIIDAIESSRKNGGIIYTLDFNIYRLLPELETQLKNKYSSTETAKILSGLQYNNFDHHDENPNGYNTAAEAVAHFVINGGQITNRDYILIDHLDADSILSSYILNHAETIDAKTSDFLLSTAKMEDYVALDRFTLESRIFDMKSEAFHKNALAIYVKDIFFHESTKSLKELETVIALSQNRTIFSQDNKDLGIAKQLRLKIREQQKEYKKQVDTNHGCLPNTAFSASPVADDLKIRELHIRYLLHRRHRLPFSYMKQFYPIFEIPIEKNTFHFNKNGVLHNIKINNNQKTHFFRFLNEGREQPFELITNNNNYLITYDRAREIVSFRDTSTNISYDNKVKIFNKYFSIGYDNTVAKFDLTEVGNVFKNIENIKRIQLVFSNLEAPISRTIAEYIYKDLKELTKQSATYAGDKHIINITYTGTNEIHIKLNKIVKEEQVPWNDRLNLSSNDQQLKNATARFLLDFMGREATTDENVQDIFYQIAENIGTFHFRHDKTTGDLTVKYYGQKPSDTIMTVDLDKGSHKQLTEQHNWGFRKEVGGGPLKGSVLAEKEIYDILENFYFSVMNKLMDWLKVDFLQNDIFHKNGLVTPDIFFSKLAPGLRFTEEQASTIANIFFGNVEGNIKVKDNNSPLANTEYLVYKKDFAINQLDYFAELNNYAHGKFIIDPEFMQYMKDTFQQFQKYVEYLKKMNILEVNEYLNTLKSFVYSRTIDEDLFFAIQELSYVPNIELLIYQGIKAISSPQIDTSNYVEALQAIYYAKMLQLKGYKILGFNFSFPYHNSLLNRTDIFDIQILAKKGHQLYAVCFAENTNEELLSEYVEKIIPEGFTQFQNKLNDFHLSIAAISKISKGNISSLGNKRAQKHIGNLNIEHFLSGENMPKALIIIPANLKPLDSDSDEPRTIKLNDETLEVFGHNVKVMIIDPKNTHETEKGGHINRRPEKSIT